jgi:small subunit ribosomal protein S9
MTQEETQRLELPSGRYYYGTGRRKCAVARVRLYQGTGQILVNGKPFAELFTRDVHQNKMRLPLNVADASGSFDIYAKVIGGGHSAWADAIAHGAARALVEFNGELRPKLRKAGLLTRDPRVKERKKPGLKRARKAPQYTKR